MLAICNNVLGCTKALKSRSGSAGGALLGEACPLGIFWGSVPALGVPEDCSSADMDDCLLSRGGLEAVLGTEDCPEGWPEPVAGAWISAFFLLSSSLSVGWAPESVAQPLQM